MDSEFVSIARLRLLRLGRYSFNITLSILHFDNNIEYNSLHNSTLMKCHLFVVKLLKRRYELPMLSPPQSLCNLALTLLFLSDQ